MAPLAKISIFLLRNVPVFAMLPETQLKELAGLVRHISVSRGTKIIASDETTDSLYIVISGRVDVVVGNEAGREVVLARLGPNEYFGEIVPIDESPRSAGVIAIEPCELLVLSKHEFMTCLSKNFRRAMAVMRGLVTRL
jgi:CRP/FNR family cyclic AMP-dependent transcriptional regulator